MQKHVTKFFQCSLTLPLMQQCLQKSTWPQFTCQIHKFNQSKRQKQNQQFLTLSLMFNSQFHLIKLYLDFRNKSAFKLGNYLSQHIPISKTPCKFFSTPSSSKAQWFNPHFHFLTGCCSNAETVFPQMSNFHTRTFSTPDVRQHPPGSRTS